MLKMGDITKVTCIIFYDEDGRVLLHNRDDAPEFWALIGGGVEEGELPLDAIKRELREELGFDVDRPIKYRISHYKTYSHKLDEESLVELHVFESKFPGFSEFKDSEEVKLTELQFFGLEEARQANKLPFAKLVLDDISGAHFVPRT